MTELSAIVTPLLDWYDRERRILPWREEPTPYRVWISEIMLQQTRVESVINYYHRFLLRFPDVNALAAAEGDEVLSYWQGLGYYRRCEMLHRAARIVAGEYGGVLPKDHAALLALPGVGRYTAAAILSIGFGEPYPAVDGNVLRVIMRVTDREDCIDEEKVKRKVEAELAAVFPVERASAFSQALMDLGATVCLPNGEPKCDRCPWNELCRGKYRWDMLPVRKTKKPRRIEERTVLLLRYGDEIGLRRRPSEGLLARLWEFPNKAGFSTENELLSLYDGDILPMAPARHIFSHVEWHMRGFEIRLRQKPAEPELVWVKKEEIRQYAIPSVFSYFKKDF